MWLKKVTSLSVFCLCLVLFKIGSSQSSATGKNAIDSILKAGIKLYNQDNYSGAITILKNVLPSTEKAGYTKGQCTALNNLGNCYSHLSKPDSAIYFYQRSYKIAENAHDSLTMGKVLKNIGVIYVETVNDFKTGLEYYDKAQVIATKAHDSSLLADCYNNKGVVFEQQKKYDTALNLYTSALKIYQAEGDKDRVSMAFNNTGIVYKYLKQYPKAIDSYTQSLKISQELKDSFMVAANLNNIANVYSLMGDHAKAIGLIKQAIDIAKKMNEKLVLIPSLDGLSDEYEATHQYDLAYKTRKEYEDEKLAAVDSDRNRNIAQLEVKYQTEEKENAIKLLKQQGEINALKLSEQQLTLKEKNFLLGLSLCIIIALFIIGYLYFSNMRIRAERTRLLAIRNTEEKERLRIAKDIHDDMGSGLSKIKILTELMTNRYSGNEEIETGIKSLTSTSSNLIENMRDLVWMLNPENTTIDNLVSRIREYSSDYLGDFPVDYVTNITETIPDTPITAEAYRNILFIVKECLQNSIKHANATEIALTMKIDEENIMISVTDNGKGFVVSESGHGNGLKNFKYRTETIGATYMVRSEPGMGTSVSIVVPVKAIQKNIIPLL